MKIKRGALVELDVTDLAFGGRGLVKVDGMAVFVEGAVPGDRVLARITKKKKQYAEARTQALISPSLDRIEPVCAYAGYCGGCKWPFLSYEKQLHYKTAQVADTLAHIGGITEVTVHPALASPRTMGYRNKMEFSCTDRRWLLPSEMNRDPQPEAGFGLGLHVPGTFNKVIDIHTCHLMPETGNQILAFIRKAMLASGKPAYGLKDHEGFWRFAMLRHSVSSDQWMVNLVTKETDFDTLKPIAEALVAAFPEVVSVINTVTARKAGVAIGESEHLLAGESVIIDQLGAYTYEISAGSFFQTNTRGAENLYAVVSAYAQLTGNERVVDLYSGTGTIPIWLSEKAGEVIGMEIIESAVTDAKRNCERNGVTNCRFACGDIRDVLPGLGMTPDLMIIDPPRVGMHKDVVTTVLTLSPARIVYVSCNPATLARDLLALKARYDVLEVQPVDMFPHTYHIEAVAHLQLR
ncbi:MAG: 23S rRNA (uracil(1939)-C(5))-methyltransferase RlmD [Deltaproteobacteria bacterium]|nr:MAG: 23S rRNA (uracil(1939)-C(5))-methyltransferase RlmD [Deltaproteobacteria bacterium]